MQFIKKTPISESVVNRNSYPAFQDNISFTISTIPTTVDVFSSNPNITNFRGWFSDWCDKRRLTRVIIIPTITEFTIMESHASCLPSAERVIWLQHSFLPLPTRLFTPSSSAASPLPPSSSLPTPSSLLASLLAPQSPASPLPFASLIPASSPLPLPSSASPLSPLSPAFPLPPPSPASPLNTSSFSSPRCRGLQQPEQERSCEVECGASCSVTPWSDWSDCKPPHPCPQGESSDHIEWSVWTEWSMWSG